MSECVGTPATRKRHSECGSLTLALAMTSEGKLVVMSFKLNFEEFSLKLDNWMAGGCVIQLNFHNKENPTKKKVFSYIEFSL